MVYTVTFNPAIDYVLQIDDLKLGQVNRTKSEDMFFGGKGINVSVVLKELGVPSTAFGFTAGFTGQAIEKGLADMGIDTDFVRLKQGNSRINVKLRSGDETELNAQGPDIDEAALSELFEKLDRLSEGDTLVLAGSIPSTLPLSIYEKILKRLSGKGIRAVVDASGELLLNVLKYRPFLIKPNNFELAQMFDATIKNTDDIAFYAGRLREMGAQNVLVSMAGEGAFLLDENGVSHTIGVCSGKVVNSVGAGDSMVAGFVAGCLSAPEGEAIDYDYALALGTAAGGATAFSKGLAGKEMIERLLSEL